MPALWAYIFQMDGFAIRGRQGPGQEIDRCRQADVGATHRERVLYPIARGRFGVGRSRYRLRGVLRVGLEFHTSLDGEQRDRPIVHAQYRPRFPRSWARGVSAVRPVSDDPGRQLGAALDAGHRDVGIAMEEPRSVRCFDRFVVGGAKYDGLGAVYK